MNILLVCAGGMSTSLLVNAMAKYADDSDHIAAVAESQVERSLDGVDVVLLGPQIKFRYAAIAAIAAQRGIPAEVMDMRAYGMMDGQAMVAQARRLISANR